MRQKWKRGEERKSAATHQLPHHSGAGLGFPRVKESRMAAEKGTNDQASGSATDALTRGKSIPSDGPFDGALNP